MKKNSKRIIGLITLMILFCSLTVSAQTITVSGKVTDSKGEPLQGASVHAVVNGKLIGMVTDAAGNYSLKGLPQNANINYSFIGYVSQKFSVNGRSTINVVLKEDAAQIDDVVVTGYQRLTKRETASAVTQIKSEEIMLNGKMSIDQMLDGQVSGMVMLQTSGEPSATPKIRIRGTSSILGNKTPVWVLDGVVLSDAVAIDNTSLEGDDAAYLIGNAVSGINPQDIETITVLKDASATAIYGVQAANGVIVITTKKGKVGKPQISYNGAMTLTDRISYGDLNRMNASERIKLSQEMMDDYSRYSTFPTELGYEGLYMQYLNREFTYSQFQSEVKKMADRNTDWYDILFRNSISHNHAIAASGGYENTTYYASVGYNSNLSSALKSKSERYTTNIKVGTWFVPKKLYVGINFIGYMTENDGYHSSVSPNNYAYQTSRTIPCYDDNGDLYYYRTTSGKNINGQTEYLRYNILNELNNTGQDSKISNLKFRFDLNWNIWNGLSYEFLGSIDNTTTNAREWATDDSYYIGVLRGYPKGSVEQNSSYEDSSVIPYGGIYSESNYKSKKYVVRNTLNYKKIFGEHDINVSAISEISQTKRTGLSGTYYGWFPDRGNTISPTYTTAYISYLEGGALRPRITDNKVNLVSWIGTATYTYKNRYVFNANVRMDGSNQFGTNPKYRFLPIWSVAGKWIVSEEPFMNKYKNIINRLSIRADYGIQGNVDAATSPDLVIRVGAMNTITKLDESSIAYLPNADLRWEKTTSYDFGIDFSAANGLVDGTIDYYKKKGVDMILNTRVSQAVGMSTVKINGGKLNNEGVEVALLFHPIKNKTWKFDVGCNFSYNKQKLIAANDGVTYGYAAKVAGSAYIVGESLGTLYSYDFSHLDHNTGYPVFRDKNGSTTYVKTLVDGSQAEIQNYTLYEDEIGLKKSGVMDPPYAGGLSFTLRYKNWSLNAGFTATWGAVGRLPSIYAETNSVFYPLLNVTKEFQHRWRTPGDELRTNIPVLFNSQEFTNLAKRDYDSDRDYLTGLQMYDNSTARVAKTDVLRLRNVNLMYHVPDKYTKKIGISGMTIALQATNLYFWADSAWGGMDPISGRASVPASRSYTLNLNFKF